MVTLIDNISYLPLNNNPIIDTNDLLNEVVKSTIEDIVDRIRNINVENEIVTVTVSGVVSISGDTTFNFDVNCENDELCAEIDELLNE